MSLRLSRFLFQHVGLPLAGRPQANLALVALLFVAFASSAHAQATGTLVGTLPGSFSVDNKGSANYSIPLSIVPGRGGMQPSIALSYSSNGGNGSLGVGFSLSTGFPQAITRGRSILARDGETRGVTFTSTDKFYLDGKRLICVSGTYGSPDSTYRTEVDSFVTVTATGTGSNIEKFTVTDKNGVQMVFGKYNGTSDAYQMAIWDIPGTSAAYSYAIKHVEDTVGNCVDFTYNYTTEVIQSVTYVRSEYTLAKIEYTGRVGVADSAQARVLFQYDQFAVTGNPPGSAARLDKRTEYIGGRRFEHFKRLDRIVAESKPTSGYETIAQYDLSYEYAPNSGPTRLKTVLPSLREPSSTTMRLVNATTFTWSDSNITYSFVSNNLYPAVLGSQDFRRFADVNGDGKDDYIDAVSSPDTIYVSLSTGTGFSAPVSWVVTPGIWNSVTKCVFLLCDLNGDGRKDIIYGSPLNGSNKTLYAMVSTGAGFVPLGGGATPTPIYTFTDDFVDPPDEQNPQAPASYEFLNMEAEMAKQRISVADFNGDGRDDILIHRYVGTLRLLVNNGASFGLQPEYTVGARSLSGYHDWALPHTYLGYRTTQYFDVQMVPCDINGDGRMDYVWYEYGKEFVAGIVDNGGAVTGYTGYSYTPLGVYSAAGSSSWSSHPAGSTTYFTQKSSSSIAANPFSNSLSYYNGNRQAYAVISLPGGGFSGKVGIGGISWGAASTGGWQEVLPHRANTWAFFPGDFNGDGLTDFLEFQPGMQIPATWDDGGVIPDRSQKVIHTKLVQALGNGQFTVQPSPPFPAQSYDGLETDPNRINENPYVKLGTKVIRPWTDIIDVGLWKNEGLASLNRQLAVSVLFATSELSLSGNMRLMDLNGDGLQDYVWYDFKTPNPGWVVMYSRGERFSEPMQASLPFPASEQIPAGSAWYYKNSLQPLELNGDGIPDYAYGFHRSEEAPGVSGFYISSGTPGTRLTAITDGLGRRTDIAYKPITDSSVYTPGAVDDPSTASVVEGVKYPIREVRNAQYVVSDVWQDAGNSVAADRAQFSYQYSGNRLDLAGRGSLGFHSFVTLDRQTNLFKYQFLAQSFPMTGLTHRDETYRWWNDGQDRFRYISSHDNTVVFDKVMNSGTAWGTVWPYISKAIEYRWEDGATPHVSFPSSSVNSQAESLFTRVKPNGEHIRISAESRFDSATTTQTTLPAALNTAGYFPSDFNGSGNNVVGIPTGGTADPKVIGSLFANLPGNITFGNLTTLATDFDPANAGQWTETVETKYLPVTSNGLSGRVERIRTYVTSPGYGTTAAPEYGPDKLYSYWTNPSGSTPTPLVLTETLDADRDGLDTGVLDLKTTYTRQPGTGLVTNTSISGYNNPGPDGATTIGSLTDANRLHIGSFEASANTTFDAKWDLPTTITNAAPYSHTVTTAYHTFLAKPTSVTDVNGAQVTTEYDAIGRVIKVTDVLRNLETTSAYAYDTSVTVAPPGTAPNYFNGVAAGSAAVGVKGVALTSAYKITVTATAKPAVTTWYDRLGRPIRTSKEGFNNTTVLTDVAYNNLGQTVATTLPYNPSDATTGPFWTKTTYDPLGRVATVTAPNSTVTTNTYRGRITQVSVDAPDLGGVNPAAQINSTLVDFKGRTVKVWNNDNQPALTYLVGTDGAATSSTTSSIAFDLDGFGRMRTTTLKGQSQTITASYDVLGRQTSLNDPDKGNWTYDNNALGQVVKQTDARGNVTRSTFDRLGRPLARQTIDGGATELASFFYYDTDSTKPNAIAKGTNGWIGAPEREEASSNYATATTNLHYYDTKGRPSVNLSRTDGKWFYTYSDYDAYSRPRQVRHYWKPSGAEAPGTQPYLWQDFGYVYTYDSKSYLTSLTDTTGRSWWDNPVYDHLDRVTSVRKGASLTTTRTYRPEDGVLTSLVTPGVQNMAFGFDGLGNLTSRSDTGVSESYQYDNLNRLEKRNSTTIASYQPNGNITSKTDVGGSNVAITNYDTNRPHAVSRYTHGGTTYNLTYDANGNLVTRAGGGTSWNIQMAGFDKPRWMAKINGATTVGSEFQYNASRSRVMQLEFDQMNASGPTRYVRKRVYAMGSTLELNYEADPPAQAPTWALMNIRIYVPGPDGIIGAREFSRPNKSTPTFTEKPLVYHYDHLGSITAITRHTTGALENDTGGKAGRFSEDAWGQRRNPFTWSGAPDTTGTNKSDDGGADSLTPRGFTGHEMLDDLGLVHMNGRIYDPLIGRFLSADLFIDGPSDLQGYNRYSYVKNRPLSLMDRNGFQSTATEPTTLLTAAEITRELAIMRQTVHGQSSLGGSFLAALPLIFANDAGNYLHQHSQRQSAATILWAQANGAISSEQAVLINRSIATLDVGYNGPNQAEFRRIPNAYGIATGGKLGDALAQRLEVNKPKTGPIVALDSKRPPGDTPVHRTGGGGDNIYLKPEEKKDKKPRWGMSVFLGGTPQLAAEQMREKFPKNDTSVVASSTVKAIENAGYTVVFDPTNTFPNHALIQHSGGVAGWEANVDKLKAVFTDTPTPDTSTANQETSPPADQSNVNQEDKLQSPENPDRKQGT